MGGGRSRYGIASGSKRGTRNAKFMDFGANYEALKKSTAFFNDPNNSNTKEWVNGLTSLEKKALQDYTGEGGIDYGVINDALYTKQWNDIPAHVQERIKAMDSAFDKSLLLQGIQVTRQCDFKIFGSNGDMSIQEIKDYIKKNGDNGVLENKGYLSFGANNHGAAIAGYGLVIHANVPPSRGAGQYVNPISLHAGSSENEFLFNRGTNFKFDVKSLHKDSEGRIHINATWVPGKKKKRKK